MSLRAIPEIEHWHQVSRSPPLPPGSLHLWRIRTEGDGQPLTDLWPLLSQHESERAGRLRFPHHRERYVRAHAGLRSILATYAKIDPQRIVFKYGQAGKPLLDGFHTFLDFNMTTSGDLALVAVSGGEPVGVDCEWMRDRGDVVAIARRMFAPEITSGIAAAAPEDLLREFHLAWTALEAGVKADGRGLSRRSEPPAQGSLQFGHCTPEPGFIAAVARKGLPAVEQWKTLELVSR